MPLCSHIHLFLIMASYQTSTTLSGVPLTPDSSPFMSPKTVHDFSFLAMKREDNNNKEMEEENDTNDKDDNDDKGEEAKNDNGDEREAEDNKGEEGETKDNKGEGEAEDNKGGEEEEAEDNKGGVSGNGRVLGISR